MMKLGFSSNNIKNRKKSRYTEKQIAREKNTNGEKKIYRKKKT
jgi:hypothetical protein